MARPTQFSQSRSPLAVIALLGVFIVALSSSAMAALVTWELNPGNVTGNVGGSSHAYTVSGYTITARGYDHVTNGSDTNHDLFYKTAGPVGGAGERGLGLVGTLDHELQINSSGTVANYIQLDLRSILAQGFTGGQLEVGSIQSGESFRLFGSNAKGDLGTQLAGTWGSAFDEQFVSIPNFGSYQFISIASNKDDVLPIAFRANVTPVPELNALFPVVGLLVAVSATQILRRRRAARLGASRT